MRTKQEKKKKKKRTCDWGGGGGEGKRDGRFTKCTARLLRPSFRPQCLSYTTCFVRCNDGGGDGDGNGPISESKRKRERKKREIAEECQN